MFALPLLILTMLVFNARMMSAHYMVRNGLNQAAKVYGEQFTIAKQTIEGRPGQTLSVNVTVKNTSNFIWPASGPNPVHMSYHILDNHKKMVVDDGLRTNLQTDLQPGQQVTLPVEMKAPEHPGSYVIQLDMVQEGVTWFGERGGEIIPLTLLNK